MCRRIARLFVLGTELDANYTAVKAATSSSGGKRHARVLSFPTSLPFGLLYMIVRNSAAFAGVPASAG